MYRIIYYDSGLLRADQKRLSKNKSIAKKILSALNTFALDPSKNWSRVKKINPKEDNIYRLRVGNFRVLMNIDHGNKIIIIYRIGPRKDIYK